MTIDRNVLPHLFAGASRHWGNTGAWLAAAVFVTRNVLMVALAAFAILVLLPAAIALQSTIRA